MEVRSRPSRLKPELEIREGEKALDWGTCVHKFATLHVFVESSSIFHQSHISSSAGPAHSSRSLASIYISPLPSRNNAKDCHALNHQHILQYLNYSNVHVNLLHNHTRTLIFLFFFFLWAFHYCMLQKQWVIELKILLISVRDCMTDVYLGQTIYFSD